MLFPGGLEPFGVFSDLELETLRMYLGGKSADDIASATGRSRKISEGNKIID